MAFFAGEVGNSLEDLVERAGKPDVVVVDPPRAGLTPKALRRLGRLEAPKTAPSGAQPSPPQQPAPSVAASATSAYLRRTSSRITSLISASVRRFASNVLNISDALISE